MQAWTANLLPNAGQPMCARVKEFDLEVWQHRLVGEWEGQTGWSSDSKLPAPWGNQANSDGFP
jgi:hypothetical protein